MHNNDDDDDDNDDGDDNNNNNNNTDNKDKFNREETLMNIRLAGKAESEYRKAFEDSVRIPKDNLRHPDARPEIRKRSYNDLIKHRQEK